MNISAYLNRLVQRIDSSGDLGKNLFTLYLMAWLSITARRPFGMNVFEEDWDLLIVLDACRVDAMRAVADEYDFVSTTDSVWSVGSTSKEWMVNTFTDTYGEDIRNTGYLTANAWANKLFAAETDFTRWTTANDDLIQQFSFSERLLSRRTVSAEDFRYYKDISTLSSENPYGGNVFAEEVTDWAIKAGRTESFDKFVVHYMQPHAPYLGRTVADGEVSTLDNHEESPFDALKSGVSQERVWNAYLDNLRYVLNNVERLLENYDAERVVITADHGELFGEFGLYSHGAGIVHPDLKRVPWVRAEAADEATHQPDPTPLSEDHTSIESRLEDLGYL